MRRMWLALIIALAGLTYPDIHNGLIYVGDNQTGLHVLKYTGPYADEVPKSAVYSSNRTSPHPSGPWGADGK